MSKHPVAIIGATGYTGFELVRLLINHPKAEIKVLTSRQHEGEFCQKYFRNLNVDSRLKFEKLNIPKISNRIKTVFLCLPHHESMEVAKKFRSRGVRVLDLSADFRIRNSAVYEKWYGKHSQKKLIQEAVYGLPEIYESQIKKTKLVAVPGCYPTSILLALYPFLSKGMISSKGIIADSKSGTSGAGKKMDSQFLFCEVNENFKAYGIGNHRHTPEIEQELSLMAKESVSINFTPHLLPIDRGILSTIYCKPTRLWKTDELILHAQKFYQKNSFVKILPEGEFPQLKNVRATNECHIGIHSDFKTELLIIISAIDNLTKGASGQAIECFNIMNNWPNYYGLKNTFA